MEKIGSSAPIAKLSLQEKFDKLLLLHNVTSQAYHNLANIINNGAHTNPHWPSCTEQTCKNNLATLNKLLES